MKNKRQEFIWIDLGACIYPTLPELPDTEPIELGPHTVLPPVGSVVQAVPEPVIPAATVIPVGCIYASYPRYKSNIFQNLFKSFKLLSKHSKYSKIFFLIFLYFYSHLFERSIIFLPYL